MSDVVPIGKISDTIKEVSSAGESKANLPIIQILILGAMAGVYLAFSTAFTIGVAATIESHSVQKLVMGAVFPIGLIAIIIGGAELFTGNAMVVPLAAMVGKVRWSAVMYNWVGTYIGNFIGGLLIAFMFVYGAHVFVGPGYGREWADLLNKIAATKTSLSFQEAFWRGVACVWLVDLAVWLSYRVKDVAAKVLLIWFPTFTFFALGLEHSVVNMYLIPSSILAGAPITWSQFLIGNLLPVTLGNTVAGVFSMAMAYWLSAGMPVLGKGAETSSPIYGSLSLLPKTLGFSLATTLGFVILLPTVPGLLMNALLQGVSASGDAATMSFGSTAAGVIFVLYLALLVFVVSKLKSRWQAQSA